jgi:hypothetical protein
VGFSDFLSSGFEVLEPFFGSGRQPHPQALFFLSVIYITSFLLVLELFAFQSLDAFLDPVQFLL